MFKYEKTYRKVQELQKKHPGKMLRDLIEMAGGTSSEYFKARRKYEAKEKKPRVKRRVKHQVIEAAAPGDNRMIFCMGTPEQIRSVLAGGAL